MKKQKTLVALVLACALCVGVLSGCGSAKSYRITEVRSTDYNEDGTVASNTYTIYDYDNGIMSELDADGDTNSYSFTYDKKTGVLHTDVEGSEDNGNVSGSSERSFFDNGLTEYLNFYLPDLDMEVTTSYNELGLPVESYYYMPTVPYEFYAFYTYGALEYQDVNGESLPTRYFVSATDADGNSVTDSAADVYVTVTYDSNGNAVQVAYVTLNGVTTSYKQYTYDSNGLVILEEDYVANDDGDFYLSTTIRRTFA
jgi:hypothetical protein